jgi:hypothetical protein
MRPLDELARLWNDTLSRMPRSAWSWSLAAAAAGAVVVLIGSGTPDLIAGSNTSLAAAPAAAATCQEQTWPYLSDACLRRNRPAADPAARGRSTQVRVLSYEPTMAGAAVGATPWASKDTSVFQPPQARRLQAKRKQATHDPDRSRTVRSGRKARNAAPQRAYVVPRDAYRAYGYAPR